MILRHSYIFLFLLMLSALFSCKREDDISDDPSARLEFSLDTVMFDTVFTGFGDNKPASVTKQIRVFNRNKNTVRTTIRVAGAYASFFKINIDGIPGPIIRDYEIRGKDSIFIFVQIYINPDNQNNPFIINDSLVFETNGNIQDVQLVGWGQNAHYFNGEVLPCNSTWVDDKPYVIYNSVLIPEGCKLTIEEGARIHSHVGSSIYVGGTLEVKGSKSKPVVFQGSRLDQSYREVPGQWTGIRMLPKSINNKIDWAIIKNGTVAVEVDSLPVNNQENLQISNSIIRNMSAVGLLGYTAKIKAVNCLVHNIGKFTFFGELGGHYTLYHCTFAGYNDFSGRSDPSFYLSNADYEPEGQPKVSNELTYDITNCIIDGTEEDEIELYEDGKGQIVKNIGFTLARVKKAGIVPDGNGNIRNVNVGFKNISLKNFLLSATSPAINAGTPLGINKDLNDDPRDSQPDLGAYEFK